MNREIMHNSLMEALEAESFLFNTPTFMLIKKTWEISKKILGCQGYTEFSPIWDKKHLKEVENVERSK